MLFRKMLIILKNCLTGLYQLAYDPCGSICLISLAIITFLAFERRVGDVAVAAVFSMITAVAAIIKHSAFNGGSIDQGPPSTASVIENEVLKQSLPPNGK